MEQGVTLTTQDDTTPVPTGETVVTDPDEWAGPGAPPEPTPGGKTATRQWAGPGSPPESPQSGDITP